MSGTVSEKQVQIRQLSASVINKIAAGEVIERPASVVKELMENSVDAGSTRIDVSIEKGGTELIRIADNGHGIAPDQLDLAITSHATSKIVDADDLFQVGTMGFRGEALASIAEISRFLLRTRTAEFDEGYEMEVHGGSASEPAPCGCPVGTIIEIRDLFFNTPVRRRFLKTPQTEMGHISEAFTRIALGNPEIHFTLTHNNKLIHELTPSYDLRDRIGKFFGPDIQNCLIPISSDDQGVHLSGFVVDPVHSRSHKRLQYLFLNGRHVKDRSLQHALGEAYRGLLLHGRHPIAFLRMTMPAEMVDVNVHPAKLEVRFKDAGRLYSQMLGTIRKMFLSTDLTARVDTRSQEGSTLPQSQQDQQPRSLGSESPLPISENQAALQFDANRQPLSDPFSIVSSNDQSGANSSPNGLHATPNNSVDNGPPRPFPTSSQQPGFSPMPGKPVPHPDDETAAIQAQRVGALQIQNRYLITETEEGMVVIDQHALHERILYEQLREKVLAGKSEKQKLLVPEPVHLTASEAALILEHQELLGKLGIDIEAFGGDTILVRSYPAMLRKHNPSEMIRQIIEELVSGEKKLDMRDLLDELLHMMSCKAAIKAGDKLAPEEITMLLEHRHYCQDAHHCPHGRPTSLVFSRDELDRLFKRI